MNHRRDWVTVIGLVLVALSAAVLTFTTLRDLAVACGVTGSFLGVPLSWLVPVTVDAAGMVAARVWLGERGDARAVRAARTLTLACIGLSIAGNAGQHGMAAFAVAVPWWVVVIVTAVPPAMLGAVGGLVHLLGWTPDEEAETVHATVTHSGSGPVRTPGPPSLTPAPDPLTPVRTPALTPGPGTLTPAPTLPATGKRGPDESQTPDDELCRRLTEWETVEGVMPSRERVRTQFGIGSKRAARLRETAMQTPSDQQDPDRTPTEETVA